MAILNTVFDALQQSIALQIVVAITAALLVSQIRFQPIFAIHGITKSF